jgi:hypothetical protein
MVELWGAFVRGGWNSWAYEIGSAALAVGLPLTVDYFFNPLGFWHAIGVLLR